MHAMQDYYVEINGDYVLSNATEVEDTSSQGKGTLFQRGSSDSDICQ